MSLRRAEAAFTPLRRRSANVHGGPVTDGAFFVMGIDRVLMAC